MSPAAKATKRTANKPRQRRLMANWSFLTSHAHVLLAVAGNPELRMRDIAQQVRITERAVQRIVADLIETGYLSRIRAGRRNQYEIHLECPLKHPLVADKTLGDLVALVRRADADRAKPADPASATDQEKGR